MCDSLLYQQITELVLPWLPNQWDEFVFYAEYDDDSYVIEFYVKDGNSWTKCFDLPGVTVHTLVPMFIEADKLISKQRYRLSAKDRWSSMTMLVTCDGSMKTDYGYEDLSESSLERKVAWKRRHLV